MCLSNLFVGIILRENKTRYKKPAHYPITLRHIGRYNEIKNIFVMSFQRFRIFVYCGGKNKQWNNSVTHVFSTCLTLHCEKLLSKAFPGTYLGLSWGAGIDVYLRISGNIK